MANIKSQKKRILTNEKARQRNQATVSALKTQARKFREALASGDRTAAETALLSACRAYDKAAAQGVRSGVPAQTVRPDSLRARRVPPDTVRRDSLGRPIRRDSLGRPIP